MTHTTRPQVQTTFAPLSAEAKQYMDDILDNFTSEHEEEGVSFAESVEGFYDNEMDDLHDSAGDPEYQAGVLERMAFIEQALGFFISHTFTAEEKQAEAPWFTA